MSTSVLQNTGWFPVNIGELAKARESNSLVFWHSDDPPFPVILSPYLYLRK